MRSAVAVSGLVMIVAACGAAPAPPVTIMNRAVTVAPSERARGDATTVGATVTYRPASIGVPAVVGWVRDHRTGEPVVGATVVLEQGGHVAYDIADEAGRFVLASPRPGVFRVVTYYGEAQFAVDRVQVTPGWQATIAQRIDTAISPSEVIELAPGPRSYGP
jgi:hypothetical protein